MRRSPIPLPVSLGLGLALLAANAPLSVAADPAPPTPVWLSPSQLTLATGNPSLALMSGGSMQVPVWSLSGGTVGQSVAGLVTGLPGDCAAVKVEVLVTQTDASTSPAFEDVYRVHLSQMIEDAPFTALYLQGTPVRTALPAGPFHTRTIVLESTTRWCRVRRSGYACSGSRAMRRTRSPTCRTGHGEGDAGAGAEEAARRGGREGLQLLADAAGHRRQARVRVHPGRWAHDRRGRPRHLCAHLHGWSKTWTQETTVANSPGYGDVPVGKGLDANGAMLLWVRRVGKERIHDLYRSTDGVTFTLLATPKLAVSPMQITDVFAVPQVG
ncbi:hypothetical protein [Verrucomicrobium spinosum]|uniref:hypothetical protein n=1 Tax=Verrucomicrobium spinosum TaxID=2736 RepID=UPI001C46222D|nr:hypothetical protein [Verrucomicrobium spinosum]